MAGADAVVVLDLDGVVNPLSATGAPARRIRLDAAVGPRIRRLDALAEVVWATTWDAATRETITGTFGLPAFRAATAEDPFLRAESPNLPAVAAWLTVHAPPEGWRGVVWIDDELGGDAREWAREQPYLVQLIRPDGVQGLRDAHVERAEEFLRALPRLG